jgi:hypothetical protein
MATTDNILQQVITYQESSLALLINQNPWIATANKKFNNFDTFAGNLGDTVSFDLPPRFIANSTLVATFQGAEQRVQNLAVDQAENVAYSFSAQQFIFNVDEYMDKFGRAAINELGSRVGQNIAENAINNTYRTFNVPAPLSNDITPINSYQQYAQALANFRNFGSPNAEAEVYVSDVSIPGVVGSGLNEFALDRNNEIANSWMLGKFSNAEFYSSNLLPIHTAGSAGQLGDVLTVDSIDVTGTMVTLSGASSDVDTYKAGDIITFATAGYDAGTSANSLYFLGFTGHQQTAQFVQARVVADAVSAAGVATVQVFPALIQDPTDANSNINQALAGNEARALTSHRAGLITAGKPLFVAMPRLPEEVPFPTANATDPDSGASFRMYYGSKFAENERGFVNDVIWGSTLVPEYSMRIAYPL